VSDEGPGATEETTAAPPPEPSNPGRPRWRTLVPVLIVGIVVGGIGVGAALVSLWRDTDPGGQATSEAIPLPPGALSAEAGRFEVTLTWSSPGSPVQGYRVYRNDMFRATVTAPATSYVDDAVPNQAYEYEVEAYQGSRTSDPASIAVHTDRAPLKLARLEGTFRVKAKVVSSSGYERYRAPRMSWVLRPKFAEGACDVVWRLLRFKGVRTGLNRAGLSYRGHDSGEMNVSCGETPSVSDITVTIRVTRARAMLNEWRVSRFVGTLTHTESSQGGCVTSSATLSVRANLASP
jgi:hypothetical protein